jgi:hypothetical protein
MHMLSDNSESSSGGEAVRGQCRRSRQLVFDYYPASNVTRISGKTIYFTLIIGTQLTLYAATLN